MLKQRPWTARLTVGASIASTLCLAQAAGLAGGGSGAALGQPLDYAVTLRLDAAEAVGPGCVAAEVSVGERRVPAGQVRVLVEPVGADAARVRVQTAVVIDEPVVGVLISASCGAAVSRRFVVFADPPASPSPALSGMPSPPTMPVDVLPVAAALPQAAEGLNRVGLRGDAVVASTPSMRSVALRSAPSTRASRRAEVRAQKRRAPAAAARAELPRRAPRTAAAAGPRLKLDFAAPAVVESNAIEQALEAVAAAAAAARQSASAASAASERISTLEQTVDQLRGESKASRDAAAQLRDQLSRAEASGRLLWPMALAAAALAALAGWLGLRLSAARRTQAMAWQQAARQAGQDQPATPSVSTFDAQHRERTMPAALDVSEADSAPPSVMPRSRPSPAWPPPAPAEDWPGHHTRPPAPAPVSPVTLRAVPSPVAAPSPVPTQAAAFNPQDSITPTQVTMALPPIHRIDGTGPRDVSIDELLDLEQQAEFFVVLGQDEAAIDLLVEHLRHTGGGSPLPYLKLLEIYRRRGDREDYERTRTRFNHRFNAYAPEWEVDLQSGRSLVDYKGVLPRLQQVWSRPLDSMAELEALLFRKSRGELFDLPAYREVLFLYALARDLLDRESADTGQVDLLLPLTDTGDFSSTAPAPFELGRDVQHGRFDFEDRPTAPVDLDLSLDSDRPASIFDPLDERVPLPRRR